ncbi:hypothetical protein Lac2_04560 [Claveliimonas bilis]|uniref:glycosyltransferase family 2 protein n=1 Tax=Claveliimonas bilis TaxID=3028070 RepID=UPI0029303A4F|nr:glycosyltransferase family 2 protein [Claveliimonas bilis]BDZ82322.1 hypothetical protein Lac2_04560 [Claveliimonas bilis]
MCKVSIIIPCYNVDEILIHRCLASIASQTYLDYEVIIVDDGSSLKYREAIDKIEAEDKDILVFHQDNKGVSAARNYGLEKSRGEYIIYVDADDYLTPCFLEEAINAAERNTADLVIGMNKTTYTVEFNEVSTEGNGEIRVYENNEIKDINQWMLGRVWYQDDGLYMGQGPWNRLVKKELALRTPFNETLPVGEDIVWNLKLLKATKKVCVVNRAWYMYYMNPGSSSRKYRENAIKESYDSLHEMKYYLDLNDDDQYLSYCLRCWSDLKRIYRCYLFRNKKYKKKETRYLYKNEPWSVLSTKRFEKLCGFKRKYMCTLYRSRLLFSYYRFKEILKAQK